MLCRVRYGRCHNGMPRPQHVHQVLAEPSTSVSKQHQHCSSEVPTLRARTAQLSPGEITAAALHRLQTSLKRTAGMSLLRSALLVVLLAAGAASVSAAATLPEALESFPDLSELAGLLKKVWGVAGAGRPTFLCRAAGATAESPACSPQEPPQPLPSSLPASNSSAEPRRVCGRGLRGHAAGAHQPGKVAAAFKVPASAWPAAGGRWQQLQAKLAAVTTIPMTGSVPASSMRSCHIAPPLSPLPPPPALLSCPLAASLHNDCRRSRPCGLPPRRRV